MSRFKSQTLLAAIAGTVVLSVQTAQAADSVTLMPSLVGSSPSSLQGNVLYVYGSAGAANYNIKYSVLGNLALGEGFGSVAAQFVPSGAAVVPGAYTADGNAVWTVTNANNTVINNTYGPNNDLVASIGAYTSAADPTRAAFAQTVSAPVGTLAVHWDGVTNNATLKMNDTADATLGQIQYQTDNLSTGQLNPGVNFAGGSQVQFIKKLGGDANGDGTVNAFDLSVLGGHWQQTGLTGGASVGDFNGDGTVNSFDLSILGGNWQKVWTTGLVPADASASAAVAAAPEPASLGVLAIGAVTLLSRRKKA
jgi:hypothetical protein